jgi:hypothetical protein
VKVKSTLLLLLNPLILITLSYHNYLIQKLMTGLLVSLIISHEENLLRAVADTVASSNISLEAYNLIPFIKSDDSNTFTWSITGGEFTTNKTRIRLWPFHFQNSISRNKFINLGNLMWMNIVIYFSITYYMIIGN